MKKLKNKIETLTQKGKNVYIVPSRGGFKYIFINFTLFLISLSYANNMALLITFLMVAYLILQMLDVHRIILESLFENCLITDDFAESQNTGLIHFKNQLPQNFRHIKMELILEDKSKVETEVIKKINETTLQFKILSELRGAYTISKIKIYTRGGSNLFYVWRYFDFKSVYYIYPKKSYSHFESKNSNDPALFNLTEEEFSHHTPYVKGQNANRIDWKVFARKDQLYWKKHIDYSSKTISISFTNQKGSVEEKLQNMSFLIEKHFKAGNSWKIVLPTKSIAANKGIKHYKESMESISEF